MERELFTRNFMTGWVLIAGFLASWLPQKNATDWAKAKDFIQGQGSDLGAVTTLVVAILGTPIVGYAVSALVLVYLYVRKSDPYMNVSRTKAKDVFQKLDPKIGETKRKCDLYAYLIYTLGPESLISWGRRRHTARFLGYNWATATVFGLVLGASLAKWKTVHSGWSVLILAVALIASGWLERAIRGGLKDGLSSANTAHYRPASLIILLLIGAGYSMTLVWKSAHAPVLVGLLCVAAIMVVLALMAEQEVEEAERLWAEDCLPRLWRKHASENKEDPCPGPVQTAPSTETRPGKAPPPTEGGLKNAVVSESRPKKSSSAHSKERDDGNG